MKCCGQITLALLWNVKKPLACSQQPSTCQHVPVRTSSSYFFLSHFSIAFTSIYLSQEISTIFSWKIFYSFCFLSKIFFYLDELKWQCVKRLLLCYEMLCIYLKLIVPLHWLNDWAAVQSYVKKKCNSSTSTGNLQQFDGVHELVRQAVHHISLIVWFYLLSLNHYTFTTRCLLC